MTAFCRNKSSSEKAKYEIEIQSLNRRHLEILLQLPPELMPMEGKFRAKISEKIHRGRLSISFKMHAHKAPPHSIELNLHYAAQLKEAAEKLCGHTQLKPTDGEIFRWITFQQGVICTETLSLPKEDQAEILTYLDKALDQLISQKEEEGAALSKDFSSRIDGISASFNKIKPLVPESENVLRERLGEKWKDLAPGSTLDDRVLKEIALLVEKADVTEELDRFTLHIQTFKDLLATEEIVSGKRLDFLCQELLREINTLNVKAQNAEISKLAIEIKSDLEKIREQIQNIE